MTQRLNTHSSKWWRAHRYELRQGVIRPAHDAETEWYAPWDVYEDRKNINSSCAPYAELLTLLDNLGLDFSGDFEKVQTDSPAFWAGVHEDFSAGDIQAVLDWCGEWGLLGVLPHDAVSISVRGNPAESPFSDGRAAASSQYQRINGRWSHAVSYGSENVKTEALMSVYSNYGGADVERATLSDAVWPFFPDVPLCEADTYCYPEPLSEQFWLQYGEPLPNFLQSAITLALAIKQMSPEYLQENFRRSRLPGNEPGSWREGTWIESPTYLQYDEWHSLADRLLAPIGQSVEYSDAGPDLRLIWNMPSLLSAFGQMAVHDAIAGVRVGRCPCCLRSYTTAAYQAIYCSQRCAWNHRKRKARIGKKTEGKING